MSRYRTTILLALVGVVALAGIALATSGTSVGNTTPAHSPMIDDPPQHYSTAALSKRLTERFGVLRRAASAADRLPDDALKVSAQFGSIPAAARKARTTPRGSLYVVPGADERVCLLDGNGAGGCNRLDANGDVRMVTTLDHFPGLEQGEVEIRGIVPDGVRSVTVTLRDSGDRTLDVVNNVYDGVLPGGPKTVTWDNGHSLDAPWMP
jgi:hypothetical protein